jgi:Fur family peroxide stress response transcriptional regulator
VKNKSIQLNERFTERLASRGFRLTPQREHVYNVLLQQRDHPTAEQVFMRAKKGMPEISMATVYNCLDALVKCRLIREVNLDRVAMHYCPNMGEHFHFFCDACGGVFDIDFVENGSNGPVEIPQGFQATGYEISVHGACPKCSAKGKTGLFAPALSPLTSKSGRRN